METTAPGQHGHYAWSLVEAGIKPDTVHVPTPHHNITGQTVLYSDLTLNNSFVITSNVQVQDWFSFLFL